ncbi:hypothetical protein X744_05220 [Mesorhizobium sp. LNJC372A00]|nr:hypothetical protein X770_05580 [Mesorhizobium sp. LSJC269B00]ESY56627.1 hypothetical protein X745_06970 [Mesorhizobium sp. LNJC374B00]ESY61269.1 hypothetical protein X744_05220 [Mesorhizobium sp. LNJC372A00]
MVEAHIARRGVRDERVLSPLRRNPAREIRLRRRDLNIGQLCRERFWRSGSLGHYVQSSASQQFDAFVWFDRTSPVQPLTAEHASSSGNT